MPELTFTDAELDRLADALAPRIEARMNERAHSSPQAAYTPRTLAAELGRSERSIRAAIARGELQAVKRGRGWVIGADAVAAWVAAPAGRSRGAGAGTTRPQRRPRSGAGPMARALKGR